MNLKQLLEETYNVKAMSDKIFKEVVVPVFEKGKHKKVDITNYFEKFFKRFKTPRKKIFFKWEKEKKQFSDDVHYVIDTSTITFAVRSFALRGKAKYRESLFHEVIHVLDYLQGKQGKIPKKYSKTVGGYYKSPTEFNALINMIKTFKNRPQYNNIQSKFNLLFYIGDKVQSRFSWLAHVDDFWYNKLLKRLSREKLLPKNFKT